MFFISMVHGLHEVVNIFFHIDALYVVGVIYVNVFFYNIVSLESGTSVLQFGAKLFFIFGCVITWSHGFLFSIFL